MVQLAQEGRQGKKGADAALYIKDVYTCNEVKIEVGGRCLKSLGKDLRGKNHTLYNDRDSPIEHLIRKKK